MSPSEPATLRRGLLACLATLWWIASAAATPDNPGVDSLVERSVVRITVAGTSTNAGPIRQSGTGFFLGGQGLIVTAFHVVGRDEVGNDIVWAQRPDGSADVSITVETFDDSHGILTAPGQPAFLRGQDASLDVAVLAIAGHGYPPAACATASLPEGTSVFGQGWRLGELVHDILGPGRAGPANPQLGIRRRIVNLTAFKGNSGGPIYDASGAVVAVLTSGRDGRLVPGAAETFATPLADVISKFPGLTCTAAPGTPATIEASSLRLGASCSLDVRGSLQGVGTLIVPSTCKTVGVSLEELGPSAHLGIETDTGAVIAVPPQAAGGIDGSPGRQPGADGSEGGDGNKGVLGAKGHQSPGIDLRIARMLGTLEIELRGQPGGQGGQGGNGGRGGAGAKGEASRSGIGVGGIGNCEAGPGRGGSGGKGGDGGIGGNGGAGGDGGPVTVSIAQTLSSQASIRVTSVGGGSGPEGSGGESGPGGLGGPEGDAVGYCKPAGRRGAVGQNGSKGRDGLPGGSGVDGPINIVLPDGSKRQATGRLIIE